MITRVWKIEEENKGQHTVNMGYGLVILSSLSIYAVIHYIFVAVSFPVANVLMLRCSLLVAG